MTGGDTSIVELSREGLIELLLAPVDPSRLGDWRSVWGREVGESLLNELVDAHIVEPAPARADSAPLHAASSPGFRYVIRDEDLKLMESAFAGFQSGTLLAASSNGLQSAAAVAGVLYAAFQVVRRAKLKGAQLSRRNAQIMTVLKRHHEEGLTASELFHIMKDVDLVAMSDVETALAELAKYPVGDGGVVAFVSVDSSGSWRVNGV